MHTKREINYDVLRLVSVIAVIMIHVSGSWVNYFLAIDSNKTSGSVAFICFSISRFAVPCFVMLSGAFILADDKNENYLYFYKKMFYKIGVPTLFFSVLYVVYRIPLCFIGNKSGISEIVKLLKDVFCGAPMYHMWYMYMLLIVYALVPITLRFKNSIPREKFVKVAVVFLILASISGWTTEGVIINWNIGQGFEYLGYFMIGYVIRDKVKKNNQSAIMFLAGGVIIECVTAYIFCMGLEQSILHPFSPNIVLASVLIFVGFSKLNISVGDWRWEKISMRSLFIYLFHAGVWDVIEKIFTLLGDDSVFLFKSLDGYLSLIGIPLFVFVVFTISMILSEIYIRIAAKIKSKHLQISA